MNRRALLVLGMHRSGTSALAGLLAHLGARAPATLMEPKPDNPHGFWESDAFYDFHERLLRAAGSDWDVWSALALNRLESPIAAAFDEEFSRLLGQEFDAAPMFVVKDPRMCRLVPFWTERLVAADVDPAPILVTRSPVEVARSLVHRDGLGAEHALLLWLRHVLDAEHHTRAMRRSVVRYTDLLDDWRAVADRMATDHGVEWPHSCDAVAAQVSAFLGPDLRHHDAGIDQLEAPSPLSEWVKETHFAFELMVARDATRTAEAFARLDAVRDVFDSIGGMFGRIVDEQRRTPRGRVARLEIDLTEQRAHAAALEREAGQWKGRAQQLEAEHSDLERRHVAAGLVLEQTNQDLDRARQDLESARGNLAATSHDLGASIDSLTARLDASEQRVRALERSLSWRLTAPLRAVLDLLLSIFSRGAR